MQQLELFDSAIVFAIHHDRDAIQKLRKTNWEAANRLLQVRELMFRMAEASKYEDYRYINHLNKILDKCLAKLAS